MTKRAALLLNLGSPDSTRVGDVRRYLREFLSDARVFDAPALKRWLILNLFVLPRRPKRSAEAYRRIWTPEGAPLIVMSQALRRRVEDSGHVPVGLGMRYGNPSTRAAVAQLASEGVRELFVMPLYPHYAMSSYETALVEAERCVREVAPQMRVDVLPPFYDDPGFVSCWAETLRPFLIKGYDRVQFSYHGVPERHVRNSDPTGHHCLRTPECCSCEHPAHAVCYRHQCLRTTQRIASAVGLKDGQWGMSFQSRFGKDPWLKPFTDETLERLPKEGVKRLLVLCPAFVTDNLETLEEIAMEGRETFIEAGGEHYDVVPCLNLREDWVAFLAAKIAAWVERREQEGVQ